MSAKELCVGDREDVLDGVASVASISEMSSSRLDGERNRRHFCNLPSF